VRAHVPHGGPSHAEDVEAPVVVEAAILARDGREHEVARQPGERHIAPPLTRRIGELAEELRLDPEEPAPFGASSEAVPQGFDASALETHRHRSSMLDPVGIGERA
jgi:hypothetical protein